MFTFYGEPLLERFEYRYKTAPGALENSLQLDLHALLCADKRWDFITMRHDLAYRVAIVEYLREYGNTVEQIWTDSGSACDLFLIEDILRNAHIDLRIRRFGGFDQDPVL